MSDGHFWSESLSEERIRNQSVGVNALSRPVQSVGFHRWPTICESQIPAWEKLAKWEECCLVLFWSKCLCHDFILNYSNAALIWSHYCGLWSWLISLLQSLALLAAAISVMDLCALWMVPQQPLYSLLIFLFLWFLTLWRWFPAHTLFILYDPLMFYSNSIHKLLDSILFIQSSLQNDECCVVARLSEASRYFWKLPLTIILRMECKWNLRSSWHHPRCCRCLHCLRRKKYSVHFSATWPFWGIGT